MTDFTSEERELAEWVYGVYIKKIDKAVGNMPHLEFDYAPDKDCWLLLARELLKKFNIKHPVKVDEHWNCGYCGNSWHIKENAEYCCNYKICFNTSRGHEASVSTEDDRAECSNHGKEHSPSEELSLCCHCGCMTKDVERNKPIGGWHYPCCGKCGSLKNEVKG